MPDKVPFTLQNLERYSRTFALAIPLLPNPGVVALSYAIARILDTIEDDIDLTDDKRLPYMNLVLDTLKDSKIGEEKGLESKLAEIKTLPGYKLLLDNFGEIVKEFQQLPQDTRDIIYDHNSLMTKGLADPEIRAVKSMTDLDRYCYYAAAVQGNLLTRLWAQQGFIPAEKVKPLTEVVAPATYSLTERFGIALQKINIIKDLPADFVEGRRFWPSDLIERQRFTYEGIFNLGTKKAEKRAFKVSGALIEDAKKDVIASLDYIKGLPTEEESKGAGGIREFCALSLLLSAATLNVCYRNQRLFVPGNDNIKISRPEVGAIRNFVKSMVRNEPNLESLKPLAEYLFDFPAHTYRGLQSP